jgi:hypothetical protein
LQTFTSDATLSGKAGANLKLEYKHGNVSIDKLSVGTDQKIVGEFTLADAVKSTDVLFKCVRGPGGSPTHLRSVLSVPSWVAGVCMAVDGGGGSWWAVVCGGVGTTFVLMGAGSLTATVPSPRTSRLASTPW